MLYAVLCAAKQGAPTSPLTIDASRSFNKIENHGDSHHQGFVKSSFRATTKVKNQLRANQVPKVLRICF